MNYSILNKAHWKLHFTEPLNYWRTALEDSYFTKNVNLQPENRNVSQLLLQPKTLHPVFSYLKEVFGAAVLTFRWKCRPSAKISSPGNPQLWFWNLDSHIHLTSLLRSVLAVPVCVSVSLVKLQQVGSHENNADTLVTNYSLNPQKPLQATERLQQKCPSPWGGKRKHDAAATS